MIRLLYVCLIGLLGVSNTLSQNLTLDYDPRYYILGTMNDYRGFNFPERREKGNVELYSKLNYYELYTGSTHINF